MRDDGALVMLVRDDGAMVMLVRDDDVGYGVVVVECLCLLSF